MFMSRHIIFGTIEFSEGKMCESNAYIYRNGSEELVMENVDFLKPEGNAVLLKSIFGEEKKIQARLKEMDLTRHKIVLEENP